MKYTEFIPCTALQPYVKCYYLYESGDNAVMEDKAYATGSIEIMFNIGNGRWQTQNSNGFQTTPLVELWGQVIAPLTFRSLGANTMLGIRFYPHTAAIFLNTDLSQFNNYVGELPDLPGKPVQELHAALCESISIQKRIDLLEAFLLKRIAGFEDKLVKARLLNSVTRELRQADFFDNIENVASRYGITPRYLQKLFVHHTGLTPKLYSKINRFQNSLQLIAKKNLSLTSIAYDCGYFDQSHFIREFRSFTGVTPSRFKTEGSTAVLASPAK